MTKANNNALEPYGGIKKSRSSRARIDRASTDEIVNAIVGCTVGIELAVAEDDNDVLVMTERIRVLCEELRGRTGE